MTLVKVYDLSTGHVETVRSFNHPGLPVGPEVERSMADEFVRTLTTQDHGTDTVYYVSEG